MSSLTLFFQIIVNPAPPIVSSRLSAAAERRRDILGLSCGRAALPALPRDVMLADRRVPTRSRRSAVTSSSARKVDRLVDGDLAAALKFS